MIQIKAAIYATLSTFLIGILVILSFLSESAAYVIMWLIGGFVFSFFLSILGILFYYLFLELLS